MILNKKKKTSIIVLSIVLIVLTFIVILFINIVSELKNGEQTLSKMTFTDINISSIKDGAYTGEFKAGLVFVKVKTTIKDKKITDIKLIEHKNGKGSGAESIISDIIAKQTTDVDMISGATISSKVIRKAIENSLVEK
ncbi:FMN-binding protein [Clostridium sp. KNHs214]|uniref:FMN-binding protein n=1 Tax=Clostridium sp. KNHs214 TaxID=1540257 RepID=UPI000558D074|nr:FMN-binding protein [Clostridium sp. KNHs214]